jgi:hypothetical protein
MVRLSINYVIPQEYNAVIEKAFALLGVNVANIWNHDVLKAGLTGIQAKSIIKLQRLIKAELWMQSKKRCTYCHWFCNRKGQFQIDHFVLKSHQEGLSKFTYEMKNLILVCKACNDRKGTSKTYDEGVPDLVTLQYVSLPFQVFHPYFHDPAEHFDISDDWGEELSPKGQRFLTMIGFDDPQQMIQILSNFRDRNRFEIGEEEEIQRIMERKRLKVDRL